MYYLIKFVILYFNVLKILKLDNELCIIIKIVRSLLWFGMRI